MKLNSNYKVETARALTELAIQHEYIPKYADETDSAEAICTFFKTIIENIDSDNNSEE